jgi:hypothetical protein
VPFEGFGDVFSPFYSLKTGMSKAGKAKDL